MYCGLHGYSLVIAEDLHHWRDSGWDKVTWRLYGGYMTVTPLAQLGLVQRYMRALGSGPVTTPMTLTTRVLLAYLDPPLYWAP